MLKNFKQIVVNEGMLLPDTIKSFKRVQRYKSNYSFDFELDKESREFLSEKLPLKCSEPLFKKIAENIIILNREKHRKTDIGRMELMKYEKYHGYQDNSFYISQI